MHLYSGCSKAFLFFVLTNYGVLTNSTEEETVKDLIFADVIKNITRVNNVLQDLIKNYEKLQRIYQSQESINSFSNEEEGEELFRGRHKKVKRNNEKSTKRNLPFPATKMIVSSEETMEKIKQPKVKGVSKNEHYNKNVRETKATTENEIVSESSSDESDDEEEKSKKAKTNSKKNTTLRVDKTTENIKHTAKVTKPANQTKTLKKQIIQTERFSEKNIWSEMVNKPVNLQIEKEIIYSKRKADKNNIYLRTEMDKKISANVSKKVVKHNDTLTSGSVENDKIIKKEQFKTAILRKAYGDACLKVVVKKCYKACTQVMKNTCSRYTCKSSFKMAFKEHSKTGCITEFRELGLRNNGKQKLADSNEKKDDSVHARADAGSEFLDITRNGYLAAACLPNSKTAINVEKKLERRSTDLDKKLNILRDRFERACQETSSIKCQAACNFAVEETCSKHECQSKKKSDLHKTCRKTCKDVYKSSRSSDSDSVSSGSGSGSGSSESDSDDKQRTKRKMKIKTTTLKRRIKIVSKSPRNAIRIKTKSAPQSLKDVDHKLTLKTDNPITIIKKEKERKKEGFK